MTICEWSDPVDECFVLGHWVVGRESAVEGDLRPELYLEDLDTNVRI